MADLPMQTKRFTGFVDFISPDGVHGWVIDLIQPDRPVRLELHVDGQAVAWRVAADLRPDVHGAGLPAEAAGFHFEFPAILRDGLQHSLSFLTEAGEQVPLDDSHSTGRTEFMVQLPALAKITAAKPVAVVKAPVAEQNSKQAASGGRNGLAAGSGVDRGPRGRNKTSSVAELATKIDNRSLITATDLFDSKWYLARYKDVALSGMDPLDHYIQFGGVEGRYPSLRFNAPRYQAVRGNDIPAGQNPLVHFALNGRPSDLIDLGFLTPFSRNSVWVGMERLGALPLFSQEDYLALNAEVSNASISVVNHAMAYGFSEGRSVFRKDKVAHVLGLLNREAPVLPPVPARNAVRTLPRVGVFYNSEGNQFIHDLAEDLAASLRLAGQDAVVLNEKSAIAARPAICIFVAPHEFFHLGGGKAWVLDDVISNAIMFNTEQPQTLWFERGMPFILMARGMIDICYHVFRMFDQAGVPAMHFNPPISDIKGSWLTTADQHHALVAVLPRQARLPADRETPMAERCIDIAFFGTASQNRENFFTRNAQFLADHECYLYYRKFPGPLVNSDRDSVLVRLAGHVATHSKILLNIHRDTYGFFEWHRIVKLGMACGSVVVSEPCLPHPVFRPNVHYFEESGRHIPNLVEWLLNSADGQKQAEAAREAVAAIVRSKSTARNIGRQLVAFLGQVMELNA